MTTTATRLTLEEKFRQHLDRLRHSRKKAARLVKAYGKDNPFPRAALIALWHYTFDLLMQDDLPEPDKLASTLQRLVSATTAATQLETSQTPGKPTSTFTAEQLKEFEDALNLL